MPMHYFYGCLKRWAGECLELHKLSLQIGSSGSTVPSEEQTVRRSLQKALENATLGGWIGKLTVSVQNTENKIKLLILQCATLVQENCLLEPMTLFPWMGSWGRLCFFLCLGVLNLQGAERLLWGAEQLWGCKPLCSAAGLAQKLHVLISEQFAGDWCFVQPPISPCKNSLLKWFLLKGYSLYWRCQFKKIKITPPKETYFVYGKKLWQMLLIYFISVAILSF